MITLKVRDKEYKLKFGYKSFKKSRVLREVIAMQRKIKNSENEENDNLDNLDMLEDIFELNSKLILAALQKYNEEFRVDYENPESIQKCIDKVDDFMDDYMDEENSMSTMDLFSALTGELFNNGFLSKKSEKLEEAMEEQDATVVPIDHLQKEN